MREGVSLSSTCILRGKDWGLGWCIWLISLSGFAEVSA